jgi:hypothetical protein
MPAVAAVAVVVAATAFVIAPGGDFAYENNLSIAEKLGAPSGCSVHRRRTWAAAEQR